jgi:LysR family glycine cleavage system transcriptional activator
MHRTPPLNALRAFEASARHLSLTKAALELSVSPGAVSHQLRGLEKLLRVRLFDRGVRKIALTPAGKMLYPGIQRGFAHISEAVAGLKQVGNQHILVVSTSPGLTSKWLAPRLYRFSNAHQDIDVRISSSFYNANFSTDGVDVAVRNMPIGHKADPSLVVEKLVEVKMVPVCSPRLIDVRGSLLTPHALARMPLIHDDALVGRATLPAWKDWFGAAGLGDVDLSRGLHFNSGDHALDAASEGAGVLLAHDLMAYDDLRTGRLVIPVPIALPSGRAYNLVYPNREHRQGDLVKAFGEWIRDEVAMLDWNSIYSERASRRRRATSSKRA